MQKRLTTTGFRKLCETQESIIARNGFKGDVTVPLPACGLLSRVSVFVQLFPARGANHTNLIILDAVLSTRVCYWVDVQSRCAWLAREFTKSLDKLLLQFVV